MDYKKKYDSEKKKNRELKSIIENKNTIIRNYDVLLSVTKDNLKMARSLLKSQDNLPK